MEFPENQIARGPGAEFEIEAGLADPLNVVAGDQHRKAGYCTSVRFSPAG